MKSQVKNQRLSRVTTTFGPNLNQVQTVQSLALTEQLTVLNAGVTSGDRHSPYPIAFTTARYKTHSGTVSTISNTGWSGTISNGVQTRVPTHAPGSALQFDSNVYNEALSKLYESIRGSLDLSVAFAESGQTSRMVRSALKLTNYIRSFHPRKWADKWLEYQYGWKPLVSDLYEAARLGQRVLSQNMKVRARSSHSSTGFNTLSDPIAPISQQTDKSYRCEICVEFQLKQSFLTQLGDITSLNPASIAWELLPYSFVVDWVYDVGGYLRNLESAALYATAFRRGYVTQGYKVYTVELQRGSKVSVQSTSTINTGGYVMNAGKNRSVLGSVPLPRLPRFKCELGAQRALSAAALLAQHLKR